MKKSCYSNNSAATASMNSRCTTAWSRSSGSAVASGALDPDALAHGDNAAGTDREALPILLQIHPDHLSRPHNDVLVQDCVAHHRATADPDARHDHAALHDRAVIHDDVRRQYGAAHRGR